MSFKVKGFEKVYTGGKASPGVYQRIINEIRPHTTFVSGFLGHCAVLRYMQKSKYIYGIDLDRTVIDRWNYMNFDWMKLLHGDFLNIIQSIITKHFYDGKICLYLDPPYMLSAIKSDRQLYMFTPDEEWHDEFISKVKYFDTLPNVDILINHYACPKYDDAFHKWRKIDYTFMSQSGLATDRLYMNYEHETGELHDYSFVGKDKDRRYNLKHRIVERLAAKLEGMEPREKQAVLHYLSQKLTYFKS